MISFIRPPALCFRKSKRSEKIFMTLSRVLEYPACNLRTELACVPMKKRCYVKRVERPIYGSFFRYNSLAKQFSRANRLQRPLVETKSCPVLVCAATFGKPAPQHSHVALGHERINGFSLIFKEIWSENAFGVQTTPNRDLFRWCPGVSSICCSCSFLQ